jgi:hypothetical protein
MCRYVTGALQSFPADNVVADANVLWLPWCGLPELVWFCKLMNGRFHHKSLKIFAINHSHTDSMRNARALLWCCLVRGLQPSVCAVGASVRW